MNKWNYVTPGIPDHIFIRDDRVPMTKSEIRVLSLARLRLFPGAVIYDIGAGSGSVAIERKLAMNNGLVYAIEKEPAALELIARNCKHFEVEISIIKGLAPEALKDLPPADRIFIGGSSGRLDDIIDAGHEKLNPGGWIVINSVTLNTGPAAFSLLKQRDYEVEAIQANIAVLDSRGSIHMWKAKNPVMIVAGQKRER